MTTKPLLLADASGAPSGDPTAIVSPSSSAPAPTAAPPAPAAAPAVPQCKDTFVFVGDVQVNTQPYIQTFLRALTFWMFPGHRAPASNFGTARGYRAAVETAAKVPGQPEDCKVKVFGMGDAPDIGTTEEMELYSQSQQLLAMENPHIEQVMDLMANHELFWSGTSDSDRDFSDPIAALIGFFLGVGGKENVRQNAHGIEAGGENKILNKEKFIGIQYERYHKKPDPIILGDADDESYALRTPKNGNLSGTKPWSDRLEVMKDFWRQEKDGVWHLLVRNDSFKVDLPPHHEWIHAMATKMSEYPSSKGPVPLYFIGLDTMDYTDHSAPLGALHGHVSKMQVEMIKAFIDDVKRTNPLAKFIFGGHYPISSTGDYLVVGDVTLINSDDVIHSGLNEVLADPAVLAYIGAHTHREEYLDLNNPVAMARVGIQGRATPLAEFTVPSVIDGPSGSMRMTVEPKGDTLELKVEYVRLEGAPIKGDSVEAQKEFEAIRKDLLTYDEAIRRMGTHQRKVLADPLTPPTEIAYRLLNIDRGELSRTGTFHDQTVAEDVILAMVADAQLLMKMFGSIVKLLLLEAGLEDEATSYDKAYGDRLKELNGFYDEIIAGRYGKFKQFNKTSGAFHRETARVLKVLQQEIPPSKTLDTRGEKLLFEYDLNVVINDMRSFFSAYQQWLIDYDLLKFNKWAPEDLTEFAKLFSSPSYRDIVSHLESIPDDSWASAFIIKAFVESGKQRDQWLKRLQYQDVPRVVTLTASSTGPELQIDVPPPPYLTDEERKKRQGALGDPEGTEAPWRKENDEQPNPSHWMLRTSFPFLNGQDEYSIQLGHQWHLVDQHNAPRINLNLQGGIALTGPTQPQFPFSTALTIGDPYGYVEVGPQLVFGIDQKAGPGFQASPNPYLGWGIEAGIAEGAVSFNGGYRNPWGDAGWTGFWGVKTDLLALWRIWQGH